MLKRFFDFLFLAILIILCIALTLIFDFIFNKHLNSNNIDFRTVIIFEFIFLALFSGLLVFYFQKKSSSSQSFLWLLPLIFPVLTSLNDTHDGYEHFENIPGEQFNNLKHSYMVIKPLYISLFNRLNDLKFDNLFERVYGSNFLLINLYSIFCGLLVFPLYRFYKFRSKKNIQSKNYLRLLAFSTLSLFILVGFVLLSVDHLNGINIINITLLYLCIYGVVFGSILILGKFANLHPIVYFSLLLAFPTVSLSSYCIKSENPHYYNQDINYRYVTLKPLAVSFYNAISTLVKNDCNCNCKNSNDLFKNKCDSDNVKLTEQNVRIYQYFSFIFIVFLFHSFYKKQFHN